MGGLLETCAVNSAPLVADDVKYTILATYVITIVYTPPPHTHAGHATVYTLDMATQKERERECVCVCVCERERERAIGPLTSLASGELFSNGKSFALGSAGSH